MALLQYIVDNGTWVNKFHPLPSSVESLDWVKGKTHSIIDACIARRSLRRETCMISSITHVTPMNSISTSHNEIPLVPEASNPSIPLVQHDISPFVLTPMNIGTCPPSPSNNVNNEDSSPISPSPKPSHELNDL